MADIHAEKPIGRTARNALLFPVLIWVIQIVDALVLRAAGGIVHLVVAAVELLLLIDGVRAGIAVMRMNRRMEVPMLPRITAVAGLFVSGGTILLILGLVIFAVLSSAR
jgi:hypothetical protein